MSPKTIMRLGPHLAAGGAAVAALRRARTSGSRLELLDAVLSVASVLTGLVLLYREVRSGEFGEDDE
jgi:hypothetical protein